MNQLKIEPRPDVEAELNNLAMSKESQPLFEAVTTQWAATLQQMVAKEVPVEEGLDQLAASIDEQLKQAGLG